MRLTEAFGLGERECIAIVGGGGKTTIMYRLAAEAAALGRNAVVGGTTRFTPPRHGQTPPIVVIGEAADPVATVVSALRDAPAVICTTGRGDKGRWLPISLAQAAALAAAPAIVLVALEADGSRNRPFKAPGAGEPVIPASATLALTVVGLDVVGQPLTEAWVHRPERVAALAGMRPGEPVSPACVARVLLHADGGRKEIPPRARWLPVLNKAEPARRAAAEEIAALLLQGGAEAIVLACAEADDPVVALLR